MFCQNSSGVSALCGFSLDGGGGLCGGTSSGSWVGTCAFSWALALGLALGLGFAFSAILISSAGRSTSGAGGSGSGVGAGAGVGAFFFLGVLAGFGVGSTAVAADSAMAASGGSSTLGVASKRATSGSVGVLTCPSGSCVVLGNSCVYCVSSVSSVSSVPGDISFSITFCILSFLTIYLS